MKLATDSTGQLLVIGLFKNDTLPKILGKDIKPFTSALQKDFCEEDFNTELFLSSGNHKFVLIVSLGKKTELTTEKSRKLAGMAINTAKSKKLSSVVFYKYFDEATHARAITEGAVLANYTFDKYKSKKSNPAVKSISIAANNILPQMKLGHVLAESTITARNLVNEPSNEMTPTLLAAHAKKLDKKLKVTVYDEKWIKKNNMNLIMAVTKASIEKPKFIVVSYKGSSSKDLYILVGKGVTYDSGGINLKPTGYLETMKDDMGGAAAVLATMQAIAKLNLKVNVKAIVPSVENMIGGKAIKPGDVFKAANGKTVEIMNTDAEGRLILGDALYYASKLKPKQIIDVATLTGAVIVALGDKYSGVMGTDQKLIDELLVASKDSDEKAWQLPMIEELSKDIKSDVSDIKNIGERKSGAGSQSGAAFLKEFTGEMNWAHFDIGGSVWSHTSDSYVKKGATGAPVRLLTQFFLNKK